MKKRATIIFIGNILVIIAIAVFMVWHYQNFLWENYLLLQLVAILIEILCFIFSIKALKLAYKDLVSENRNFLASKKLTKEEIELVEDAKKLIQTVSPTIQIFDFKVYKVHFIKRGWFYYDEKTNEKCVFIPFKRFLKMGKEFCFMAVVHEILHSQNLKDNKEVFSTEFLEGMNQFFTNWLIENYSTKYKIPETICVMAIELKSETIEFQSKYKVYEKEVQTVKEILQKSRREVKEAFLKYIDFHPEFFKEFVPIEYYK